MFDLCIPVISSNNSNTIIPPREGTKILSESLNLRELFPFVLFPVELLNGPEFNKSLEFRCLYDF